MKTALASGNGSALQTTDADVRITLLRDISDGESIIVRDVAAGTLFVLTGLWTPLEHLHGRRCSYHDVNLDGVCDHRLWHTVEPVDLDGDGRISADVDGLLLRRGGAEVIQSGVALAVDVLAALFPAGARMARVGM